MKGLKMQLRMSARVLAAAGALALATALTSCGFDYATDRDYQAGAGTNNRDASVDVLGAVVVSAQSGSGTFVASFANNNQDESASVDSLAGAGDDTDLKIHDFQPIQIEPGQLVNLATDGGIVVSGGQVSSGDSVTLEFGLGDGETVQMNVPVVPPCHEYFGLDRSEGAPLTTAECKPEAPDTTEQ